MPLLKRAIASYRQDTAPDPNATSLRARVYFWFGRRQGLLEGGVNLGELTAAKFNGCRRFPRGLLTLAGEQEQSRQGPARFEPARGGIDGVAERGLGERGIAGQRVQRGEVIPGVLPILGRDGGALSRGNSVTKRCAAGDDVR